MGVHTNRCVLGRPYGIRQLVYLGHELALAELEAETDEDAVEFYRRCGFDVESIPEEGGRRRRFRCRATCC